MTTRKKQAGGRKAARKSKATKKIAGKKTAAKKTTTRKRPVRKKSDRKKRVLQKSGRRQHAWKDSATATRAVKGQASKATSVPNIDYSLCEGCGGCAEAFPHLFEMRGERAWVIDPEGFDPVRDAGVMTICPYYAISIERV